MRLGSDADKYSSNIVSLTSPSSVHTAKTAEVNIFKTQPEVVNYSINTLKTDLEKVHSLNLMKQRNLEHRLKKLEKKSSVIKEYTSANCFPQSKYLQISLNKQASKVEKRERVRKVSKSNSINTSVTKYSSKEKVFRNYWKNKTTKYSSSKFLLKKSPILKQKKLSKVTEKEINNPKLQSKYSVRSEKKQSLGMAQNLLQKKESTTNTFSKKMRSYNKNKTMAGHMTSRASKVHTRNASKSIYREETKYSSTTTPLGESRSKNRQNTDFSSTLAEMR